jgi:hypothetical protein
VWLLRPVALDQRLPGSDRPLARNFFPRRAGRRRLASAA